MNGRRIAALLIAILALVAAGCGGSSNNEASSDTETTIATTETETETEASTDDSTATESEPDIDTSALTGKCAELAQLGAKLSQSMAGQDADLEDASRFFDELAGQVPDEIKGDYAVIAKNFKKIAEALKGVDLQSGKTPTPDQAAKLQQVVASLDNAEVQKATQHIEAWAQANC